MVEEVKKTRDLKELKIKTEQQIKYLYEKAILSEEEIYTMIKDFFGSLLELDYQFSHEELLDELNKTYIDSKIKQDIEVMVKNIGRIEYNSSVSFQPEELKQFLSQLQEISDKLILEEAKQNSKGFSLFSRQEERSIGSIIEDVKSETKIEKAKKYYQEALTKYNSMSKKDQEFYYERLQEAYEHLKSSLN